MTDFKDLIVVPEVFEGPAGNAYVEMLSALANRSAEGQRHAVRGHWIGDALNGGIGPSYDALESQGNETGFLRYPGEEWQSHHDRINAVWDKMPIAGTAPLIVSELEAAGFPGASIETPVERPLHPGPHGELPYWSQFWVVFQDGFSYGAPPAAYGSGGLYGDGQVFGIQGMTADQVNTIRRIVRKFKPGHWICRAAAFIFGPRYGIEDLHYGDVDLEFGGVQIDLQV